jgi:hypothetical protein
MGEEGEEQKPQTREAGEAAAAMDKVTDFAEEKEMRANVDKSKVQQAMQKLAAEQAARKEVQRQRERELAAVKVGRVGRMVVVHHRQLHTCMFCLKG